jgi:HD-like signal output (HDOD) protein
MKVKLKWYANKNQDFFINVKDIQDSDFDQINPFFIKFFYLNDEVLNLIKEALFIFLNHIDRLELKETLYNVIREILSNSIKANLKRSYFFFKGKNINDADDYKMLMKNFDESIKVFNKKFPERMKKEKRYVMLRLFYDGHNINIDVKNNSAIIDEEMKEVEIRVKKAKDFISMSDLFDAHFNDKEGPGLGIGMLIYLLKNEGIDEDSFTIKTDGESTYTQIKIPLIIDREQSGFKIAESMVREVDELPTFDENVRYIQNLILNPNSTIDEIALAVQNDISITSNLLKLVNSAAFALNSRIDNVSRAIQIIGLKELNSMLYSIGTKRIMEGRYEAFEEIWETSKECSFICRLLANKKRFSKEITNNMVIAGLLHDVGRVIILTMEKETLKSVVRFAGLRNESPDITLEEAAIGISHTDIGSMIAQKWNFPENIQKSINYHHNPYLLDDEQYRYIVYAVYLSDKIIEYNQGFNNYENIYKPCLDYFDFNEENYNKFAIIAKKRYIMNTYDR